MPVELSVIIVNHNGRAYLADCLSSLLRERSRRRWEVLVVDNASRDGSAEEAAKRFPEVCLIRNKKNTGFAAANNLGLARCRGEFILFLNPDTRLEAGALRTLLGEMKSDPGIGAAGPALLTGEDSRQVSFGGDVNFFREAVQKSVLNALWRKRLKRLTRRRDVAWLSGACLMTRRRALESSGGFDEDFFLYFEDIDLCRRIRKAGFRAVFFPGARVFHAGGASASAAPLRSRLAYRRSQLVYYRKHASRISRWLLRAALNAGARLDLIFRGAGSEKREFARALLRLLKSPERTVPRGRTRVLEVIDKPFLGGGQKTVLLLAGGLDRREFEVGVCSTGGGPLVGELEKRGVRHFSLPLDRKAVPGIVRRLRKLIREESFDIVHTHGGVAGLYGRLAARRTRAAVVHTLHGIHYLHYRRPLLRRTFILLERLMSRSTDAVVCVSLSDRDAALRHKLAPAGKLRIIKNGIDFRIPPGRKMSKPLGKELRAGGTGPVVGTVARLHRQKGLVYFLRAVPAILKAHPRVRVVIAGGGPLRAGLEEEAARLGVRNAVLFLGERADAADILGLLDVFVLPSLWEGLPYVLGEAAHAGRPIVATDIEGTREVIRDGVNGLLVPPADSEALALAVNLLLGDAALRARLASAARKTVPGHFDLGRMLRLTGALYRELKTNYNLHP